MKKKVIELIKEMIGLAICMAIIECLFVQLHLMESFDIVTYFGFMIGWIIVKIIQMLMEKKK